MRLFNVNPRTFIAIGHDIIVAALVWSFTFSLRWNFDLDRSTQILLFQTLPAVLAVQVGCFVYFGLYRGIWRYASIHDMRLIAMAVGTSALIIPILLLLWRNGLGVPRSLYFLNPLLLILFMCTGRLLYRWWKEKAMGKKGVEPQPVILLGAGTAALSLIDELNRNPYWYVIGVLDDNPNKVGRQLGGVRILGSWENLEEITRDSNCKHAVLAVGATNHATRRRVFELCERANIKLLVIPDVQELMSGQVKVSQIRYVDVDDLLGRDPVSLDTGGLRHMLHGKSVLVTGGGGSIGSELCRQIARFEPAQIIIFELSEFALYRATEDLHKSFPALHIVPVLGDIKNRNRLQEVFERHHPTIIYHAAAYKHVPILEEGNAWQSVSNNAYGTRVLAEVAMQFEVERFVYISSDKAVNPTNVMGATKRLAEMILQYLHSMGALPVVSVRFGNVLGSSGSVIPKFREQIANGGPITVTHPDITRYFMSIPEATQLVLQAGLMGRGGETFVLDMGQPIRIVDLARTMIKLSGYTEAEIPIAFTGLRPGEKLYEELLADNEKTLPTPHAKLRVSRPIDPPGTSWDISVRRWLETSDSVGDSEVRHMLSLWVPEYRPAPLYRQDGTVVTGGDGPTPLPQPAQPAVVQPATTQPAVAQAGSAQSAVMQAGGAQPATVTAQAGIVQAGVAQPASAQPAVQAGATQPVTAQSGTAQSGVTQPTAPQAGTAQMLVTQPAAAQAGAARAGAAQPVSQTASARPVAPVVPAPAVGKAPASTVTPASDTTVAAAAAAATGAALGTDSGTTAAGVLANVVNNVRTGNLPQGAQPSGKNTAQEADSTAHAAPSSATPAASATSRPKPPVEQAAEAAKAESTAEAAPATNAAAAPTDADANASIGDDGADKEGSAEAPAVSPAPKARRKRANRKKDAS